MHYLGKARELGSVPMDGNQIVGEGCLGEIGNSVFNFTFSPTEMFFNLSS